MGNLQNKSNDTHYDSTIINIQQHEKKNSRCEPKTAKEIHLSQFEMENTKFELKETRMRVITVPCKPHNHKWCRVIKNVLNKQECDQLINVSEQYGYGLGYIGSRDAKYDRVLIESQDISSLIFKRIKRYIPKIWRNDESKKLLGVNEKLRFLRYDINGHFAVHKDGPSLTQNGDKSTVTALIYLNKVEKGGATILHDLDNHDNHIYIVPQPGLILLFEHDVYHEGDIIIKGQKYVIRTDIMYTTINSLSLNNLNHQLTENDDDIYDNYSRCIVEGFIRQYTHYTKLIPHDILKLICKLVNLPLPV